MIVIARILCISDLHKRYKEGSSVKNNIEVQKLIQEDIIAFNIELWELAYKVISFIELFETVAVVTMKIFIVSLLSEHT